LDLGVFRRIWLLTVVALVLVWCFAMEVFVCCCFWRSYWRGFVAPVEAMVVDLGVLGGGHEIWAIEVLWWLCGFCIAVDGGGAAAGFCFHKVKGFMFWWWALRW
jgi:hypothetical protein